MNRDEFIATCFICGYAPRKFAAAYAGEREEMTDEDYIEVYRRYQRNKDVRERASDKAHGRRMYQGVKTTKHLSDEQDMGKEDNR